MGWNGVEWGEPPGGWSKFAEIADIALAVIGKPSLTTETRRHGDAENSRGKAKALRLNTRLF